MKTENIKKAWKARKFETAHTNKCINIANNNDLVKDVNMISEDWKLARHTWKMSIHFYELIFFNPKFYPEASKLCQN